MRIGLAVILLAAALAARGDALDVRTAQVDDLTGASRVVINVTFDADGAFNAISNRADALIKAVAPTTGDYGTVSNRAMSALQSHQSLAPSTNYTDAALGAFAATGTVARANVYGTPTRWTDATGCVWACEIHFPATVQIQDAGTYPYSGFVNGSHKWEITEHNYVSYVPNDTQWTYYNTDSSTGSGAWLGISPIETGANSITLESPFGASPVTLLYSGYGPVTNLVGRVALTNDIPDVPPETDPTVPSWAKVETPPYLTSYTETDPTVPAWAKVATPPYLTSYTETDPTVPSWAKVATPPYLTSYTETDPNVPSWAKAPSKPTYTAIEVGATDGAAVTNIMRQLSLGGIYDDKLGVWWTPHMSGGAYYWTATTNVNLSAEGN